MQPHDRPRYGDEGAVDHGKLLEHIRSIGYTVQELEAVIITTCDN